MHFADMWVAYALAVIICSAFAHCLIGSAEFQMMKEPRRVSFFNELNPNFSLDKRLTPVRGKLLDDDINTTQARCTLNTRNTKTYLTIHYLCSVDSPVAFSNL